MSINAAMNWWVRAGGDQLNGGGYDETVSGAGTNFCDQDSPQLSLSDFATSGAASTTLTSATGGFTAAMIGNVIRIASGTNFQTGYYVITAYTNTNTVTLDRTPTSGGAGSGGVGRVGGAHPGFINYGIGGTATQPTITSPLAAGHRINVRGSGSSDPGSPDYTQSGYYTLTSGDETSGHIHIKGYNGRPRFNVANLLIYDAGFLRVSGIVCHATGADFAVNGFFGVNSGNHRSFADCIFDINGIDMAVAQAVEAFLNCTIRNSGSTSAGSYPALLLDSYNAVVSGVYCRNFRGYFATVVNMATINNSVIAGCRHGSNAAFVVNLAANSYKANFNRVTIYGSTGSGISLTAAQDIFNTSINNCVFDSNGGYGITCATGTQARNDRMKPHWDYNAFRNNSSGARNAVGAGDHDVTLSADPFTNAGSGDFSLNNTAGGGAALRAAGFPGAYLGGLTTGYLDIGAVQHQSVAGGGGLSRPVGMGGGLV